MIWDCVDRRRSNAFTRMHAVRTVRGDEPEDVDELARGVAGRGDERLWGEGEVCEVGGSCAVWWVVNGIVRFFSDPHHDDGDNDEDQPEQKVQENCADLRHGVLGEREGGEVRERRDGGAEQLQQRHRRPEALPVHQRLGVERLQDDDGQP